MLACCSFNLLHQHLADGAVIHLDDVDAVLGCADLAAVKGVVSSTSFSLLTTSTIILLILSYTYEITNDDVKRGNASEVQLAVVYKVSVYATKYGYEDSDVATAEFTFGGNVDTGVRGDMNGDNIVNALDIQTIIMIAAMF